MLHNFVVAIFRYCPRDASLQGVRAQQIDIQHSPMAWIPQQSGKEKMNFLIKLSYIFNLILFIHSAEPCDIYYIFVSTVELP